MFLKKHWKIWSLLFTAVVSAVLWTLQENNDVGFIRQHQEELRKEIEAILNEEERIQVVTILPHTAKGYYDNGGDVGGNYHISFRAYVNHNRHYAMMVKLTFPHVYIGPLTFFPKSPYKSEAADMGDWFMEVITDETEEWKWKQEKEQEVADEERQAILAEEEKKKELSNQIRPHLNEWLAQHQLSLATELEELLYSRHPELRTVLGSIETLSFYDDWRYYKNGDLLLLEIHFKEFPDDTAKIRGHLFLDDFSFQDLSQGGTLSFSSSGMSYFELETKYDTPIDKAVRKVHGREFIIRDIKDIRIE